MSGTRPEHLAPPEIFYNDDEAAKYTNNSRIQSIQAEMTYRCIELLDLDTDADGDSLPCHLLDIGAGSGLSGEILSDEGHEWTGMDISGGMLQVAIEREVDGDLLLADIGQGVPFRPGSFDGAISVSVLQWLCNADSTANSPAKRLSRFFTDLFGSLVRGARAVFQFYPESDDQVRLIMSFATKAGFDGGLVVDYPNSSKKKKMYLVLQAGPSQRKKAEPVPLSDVASAVGQSGQIAYEKQRMKMDKHRSKKNRKGASSTRDVEWIKRKKELYRQRGKEGVPRDSKFTGRPRKVRF